MVCLRWFPFQRALHNLIATNVELYKPWQVTLEKVESRVAQTIVIWIVYSVHSRSSFRTGRSRPSIVSTVKDVSPLWERSSITREYAWLDIVAKNWSLRRLRLKDILWRLYLSLRLFSIVSIAESKAAGPSDHRYSKLPLSYPSKVIFGRSWAGDWGILRLSIGPIWRDLFLRIGPSLVKIRYDWDCLNQASLGEKKTHLAAGADLRYVVLPRDRWGKDWPSLWVCDLQQATSSAAPYKTLFHRPQYKTWRDHWDCLR